MYLPKLIRMKKRYLLRRFYHRYKARQRGSPSSPHASIRQGGFIIKEVFIKQLRDKMEFLHTAVQETVSSRYNGGPILPRGFRGVRERGSLYSGGASPSGGCTVHELTPEINCINTTTWDWRYSHCKDTFTCVLFRGRIFRRGNF